MRDTPKVFISSTAEDLTEYRLAAHDAAIRAGFTPVMMEYFVASGAKPPLAACLDKVRATDVVVILVGKWYGWKPPGQTKSITWLECEAAPEVIPFVVDPKADWPADLEEEYRLTDALKRGQFSIDLAGDVQQSVEGLKQFRAWLDSKGIRETFKNPDDLRGKVESALRQWRDDHGYTRPAAVNDPRRYLQDLCEQTRYIDIRGLQVGTGKAYRFPITDLYIPLTTAHVGGGRDRVAEEARRASRLEEALDESRLVIVGDPGSGKTTFLRWLVFQLAQSVMLEGAYARETALPSAGEGGMGRLFRLFAQRPERSTGRKPLPVLVRIAELAEYIRKRSGHTDSTTQESPEWLVHFLAAKGEALNWSLDGAFFKRTLSEGPCVLLLDGLDEVPSVEERTRMARIFENATRAYPECRIVVTTRPQAYAGTALLAGFTEARIEPLDDAAIGQFLEHWCQALFPTSQGDAKAHLAGLQLALHAKVEIRRMVVNPVMLTALAVVHWNEKRIPEQRAELYESVLQWLARSREQRPGRASATRCLKLLQLLALAMQDHPGGRKTELSLGESAGLLCGEFDGDRSAAEAFLAEEETDSGIIVRRDSRLRFWHLTFQEYLAARRIAGFGDEQQHTLLLDKDKIYGPEWRECALLLSGVLMGQGEERVEGLIAALLDRLGGTPALAQQARTAGLLGAIVGDLRPFQYEPKDPRYARLMDAVLGVFKAESVDVIDFKTRLEAAEALGQAGDPRLGKPENWILIECEKPFRIARYLVTVQEYKSFVEDGGYQDERWWAAGGFGRWQEPDKWAEQLAFPNRPVVYVGWFEAAAYARWAGVRLLTEAEWERAARGGEGREYPWGKEAPSPRLANYDEGKVGHPTPVGLYPLGATPEGIQDLAGNVWEWCEDWYDPAKKEGRVERGGSWGSFGSYLRGAYRGYYLPEDRLDFRGFRVGREVNSP